MKEWSKNWITSTKPKKQRKYRYNAPLSIKRKFTAAHLSKELRQKYNKRSLPVVEGDKVKISRGQFAGVVAKVNEVNLKKTRIFIEGVELPKKDGSKSKYPIHPSNVIITELNLEDKKRTAILDRKKVSKKN
jgi:large subunit ribosomal protein L24